MARLAILVAVLAALFGPPARAEIVGAEAPAFREALAAWLADDDAEALPAFAALAAEGNAAARILLALVDRMPETHSLWLASLTRAERARLMRAPTGRSWMEVADSDLSRLWLAVWDADTPPETAFAFVDMGEPRAARLALLALAARQRSGFRALAADPRYPPELRFLAWAEARDAPESRAEIAALAPGDPQAARLDAAAADPEALVVWLLEAPIAAPVARFCAATCPADAAGCARAAYDGLGGYRGLLSLGPPSEILIPADVWAESPKGAQALLRRIALRRPPVIADACVARAVAFSP